MSLVRGDLTPSWLLKFILPNGKLQLKMGEKPKARLGKPADRHHDNNSMIDMTKFEQIVALNRRAGIDPISPEPKGAVVYKNDHLVPMSGDTFWDSGRTISRKEVDRRFKHLKL